MDWELVKDIAIPMAAILVPSGIAIWLASGERKAAERDREISREQERRREITEAIDHALDAVSHITAAIYTDDFRRAAQIRVQAARSLSRAQGALIGEHVPLGNWIATELQIIAVQGLERTDEHHLPVLADQSLWRAAGIIQAIQDWHEGDKDLKWFSDAEQLPLAQTQQPQISPLPD